RPISMINSHLLYRLSYRGTVHLQLCDMNNVAFMLQRRAILPGQSPLSTLCMRLCHEKTKPSDLTYAVHSALCSHCAPCYICAQLLTLSCAGPQATGRIVNEHPGPTRHTADCRPARHSATPRRTHAALSSATDELPGRTPERSLRPG